jgi:hypothetical protein
MRWDLLFNDLEAQAASLERAERAGEVEERARAEISAAGMGDRLRPARGTTLRLRCTGGHAVTGVLRRVGPDWLLFGGDQGRECVVALAAVVSVLGLGRLLAPAGSESVVESRLGLRHALRGIVRDRSGVRVHLIDGTTLDGTLDRVGLDFLELALHPAGEPRRRTAVSEVALLPLAVLAVIGREAEPG